MARPGDTGANHKEDAAGREAPGATGGEKPSKVGSPRTAAARNKAAGQGAEGSVEGARNPGDAAKPEEASPAARGREPERGVAAPAENVEGPEDSEGGEPQRESAAVERDKAEASDG